MCTDLTVRDLLKQIVLFAVSLPEKNDGACVRVLPSACLIYLSPTSTIRNINFG